MRRIPLLDARMSATFLLLIAYLLSLSCAQDIKTNKVTKQVTHQVNNTVQGDQSYGGIHLFEWHGQHGGIGLGWKILFVLVLVLLLAYWWMKRKANKCFGLLPTLMPQAMPAAPPPPAPIAPPVGGYPLVLYQQPLPVPAPRHGRRHDDDDEDDD